MEAPDGQSYSGIAWSTVHYGTSNIFDNTVIKALTYKSDGEKLIIDGLVKINGEVVKKMGQKMMEFGYKIGTTYIAICSAIYRHFVMQI